MAWHFTELYKAIYDRFAADATLGGLIQGAWSSRAPDTVGQGTPVTTYIVTNLQTAGAQDEAFRTLARTFRLAVTIIVPSEATGATDPIDLEGQIAARVEGNWEDKTFGVQPDYGLARWTPSLASWNCTTMNLIDIQSLDAGDNRRALGMAFEATVTKEAV